ncbi:MAG: beta-ketoacyl synthase N-terminal-like domain-containing protein, partial [Ardenticatenaceae bacterium]|nr:beta-ketoacyl synthase N-terminal-like domain-containing protein [Ardenticatenaceae bacterium]
MNPYERAVAIVGVGALLPDAPNAETFWQNILNKRYSISEVPPGRWGQGDYYDSNPKTPDKSYSKIGGWIKDFEFDWKQFRIPPKVVAAMDPSQQWSLTVAAEALKDYGYPERPLNTERTAVVIGTAMGGELYSTTNMRIYFPEYTAALEKAETFQELPPQLRESMIAEWQTELNEQIPTITEDSMPGELPNIVSGRIANVLNLRGPNFITDAACASSMAALESAVEMLTEHKVDAVVTGGVDRNMGASTFIKFCKIGALSATGTRPFGDGADGFVMGEGAAVFLLKRLADAERDGDKIYAVIRGVGGASDGKGKGITAPNPIGQQLAMQRAWENAELDPTTATMIEAHGTSTRVGDVVEVESLATIFGKAREKAIGLGSVKSNIGHLKAGAGAAGMLKTALALYHKILPPTLNAETPNPNINFAETPFVLLNEAKPWNKNNGSPRRAGISAYGFGGTNFHVVMEEYVPGQIKKESEALTAQTRSTMTNGSGRTTPPSLPPARGILSIGANSPAALKEQVDALLKQVEGGWTPPTALPDIKTRQAAERLFIDFGDREELLDRLQKARKVMGFDTPEAWKAMQNQGIFRGSGRPNGKIAFMFPGQGSQYVNMGRELAEKYPIVAETIAEADEVMTPILGKPLSSYLFVDPDDKAAVNQAMVDLMQTAITQPAMLTLDTAIFRLLEQFGFQPDMVIGHSLGEYAGLIAAGILPFSEALEASAARGREMSVIDVPDNGKMAAVMAPYDELIAILNEVNGYVVPANINSRSQCVIGGSSSGVDEAMAIFAERGYQAIQLPVSHAFHTEIVAPASAPLRQVLNRMHVRPPQLPLVANVTGRYYPTEVEPIKDMLEKQIASPVQWVKGMQTLHETGARFFLEVGPKRALRGFANDIFKGQKDVTAMLTNHPKTGEMAAFNQALCSLFAAGYGTDDRPQTTDLRQKSLVEETLQKSAPAVDNGQTGGDMAQLVNLFSQALGQINQQPQSQPAAGPYDRNSEPDGSVVISGTGLGLPGAEKSVMDPENALRILHGEQFIDLIPERFRQKIVDKRIVRVVKGEDGSGSFATIDDPADVVKLAGRPGTFDLAAEYGVPEKLVDALDITTQLAIAAGLDALREAGIPLVQMYKRTTTGRYLPERWVLPEALRDDTGVIFASAFPGGDRFADEFKRYYAFQNQLDQIAMLEDLRRATSDEQTLQEITRRLNTLREEAQADPYIFDRRFLFRILAMGHSQFAQYIGARGPNTHVNAACASTAQAVSIAEDWIRSGRCRRVVVVAADDVTGDHLMEWVGAGFLAVGAVTTEEKVADAALPFDRRRHGTILGMGACGIIVESEDAVRERGMRGIVELLSSETSNSAFHGTRLDVEHISQVMENLVSAAERRFGLNRYAIAGQTVFMSHETFTPARGGSASAEVVALRETFGSAASDIIVANTKGFTGHPMGVGVEDVIAIKILEHGIVPPVPNYKEEDPDLGRLNLSRGGRYPVQYALHLAAGFGSQIAFTFLRRIPGAMNRIDEKPRYQQWLDDISGYNFAQTEVEKRVLRIKAEGPPPRPAAANDWRYGTGPVVRAAFAPMGEVRPQTTDVRPQTSDQRPETRDQRVEAPPPAPAPTPTPAAQAEAFVKSYQPVTLESTEKRPDPVGPQHAAAADPTPVGARLAVPDTSVADQRPETGDERPAAPAAPAVDEVVEKVLAIVAEQTGYPTDMLDLDLDLEADLGVDTVKQAETFLAIREAFDIPRQDD